MLCVFDFINTSQISILKSFSKIIRDRAKVNLLYIHITFIFIPFMNYTLFISLKRKLSRNFQLKISVKNFCNRFLKFK